MNKPLIIAYYDGDDEVQSLSNFAVAPFTLDGIPYKCVEGFWQSLKTEIPILRERFSFYEGLDAKQAGAMVKRQNNSNIFTYMGKMFRSGSKEHHILLERAIRAKVDQNPKVAQDLIATGNRPLKHMLLNHRKMWRTGDSLALPAITFERILMQIRTELLAGTFTPTLEIPLGFNETTE